MLTKFRILADMYKKKQRWNLFSDKYVDKA